MRAAMLTARRDTLSAPASAVTNLRSAGPDADAAVRSVRWDVVTLAEQAPHLSDEQVRSRLALSGLVR